MATVLITVVDNNDNLPQFEQDFYTANVSELESTGRTVLTVSASDRDTVSTLQLGKFALVLLYYDALRDLMLNSCTNWRTWTTPVPCPSLSPQKVLSLSLMN